MNTFSKIAVVYLLILASADVFATSRTYSTIDQLIAKSDVIALVTVSEPNEKNRIQRIKTQAYGIASPVKVKKSIKGDIPDAFLVHHMSALDDCLFQQGEGDYIVFLRSEGDFYVPSDGWPSSKHVQNMKVAGWSDNHSFQRDYKSLKDVLNEIEAKTKG